ncbi:hypothetical protein QBC38DRAFT_485180 [Podospora fimiseda]|uniref:Uncharacterized protein n=1 Tax=Podospora fimiseda TaxID=252190 RepID=A0AAN7BJQ3_9PEZI|nr:hypothetical protein QBC38DRAFT_485180 [Podospora fimiseda]
MIPRILRRFTQKFILQCRQVTTKTPGNPYPLIGALDYVPETPILPEDMPELRYLNPKTPSDDNSEAQPVRPGSKVQNFSRQHNVLFWTDAKPPRGQGKLNSHGFRIRYSKNHTFSNYDEEPLGYKPHPLTDKVLWRYLQKKKTPLWVYATAYLGPNNSIAVVRRKCAKKMKAALYFALAELGFDKNGRALKEGRKDVFQGTFFLTGYQPEKVMAAEFGVVVKDLAEVLRNEVILNMTTGRTPQRGGQGQSRFPNKRY